MQSSLRDENNPAVKSKEEIQAWLVSQVAGLLYVNPAEIDMQASFNSYGLSSRDAVMLSGDLEEWLDRRLSPTLVYEYPTISALTNFLSADGVHSTAQSHGDHLITAGAPASIQASMDEKRLADVELLSEAEAEALLLEQLNRLKPI
jgi:acyl carrier protein